MATLESIERSETELDVQSVACLVDRDSAESIRSEAQAGIDKLRTDGMDADTLHEVERTPR